MSIVQDCEKCVALKDYTRPSKLCHNNFGPPEFVPGGTNLSIKMDPPEQFYRILPDKSGSPLIKMALGTKLSDLGTNCLIKMDLGTKLSNYLDKNGPRNKNIDKLPDKNGPRNN